MADSGAEPTIEDLLELIRESNSALNRRIDELFEDGSLGAAARGGEKEPAAPWAARSTPEAWAELADWVDWAQRVYVARRDSAFSACWPAHPAAVEELAALRASWVDAMSKDRASKSVGDAAAYWHDRYLSGAIDRVRLHLSKCRDGEHQPGPEPAVTDRSFLPR